MFFFSLCRHLIAAVLLNFDPEAKKKKKKKCEINGFLLEINLFIRVLLLHVSNNKYYLLVLTDSDNKHHLMSSYFGCENIDLTHTRVQARCQLSGLQ